MFDRNQSKQNGLQEVHRLLKKFNAIREERARKYLNKDLNDEVDCNRYDIGDCNPLIQVSTYYIFQKLKKKT